MKNLIVFVLSFILLISSAVVCAQGKGKGKDKDFNLNKGQVNSTIRKETNPGNSGMFDEKGGKKDKDDKKDISDKKDKDTQLEKSLKKEGKKAIKEVLK